MTTKMSSNLEQIIEAECEKHFSPTIYVKCMDQSDGCGSKLNLTIVSDKFVGVPLIQRHRKVQGILKNAQIEYHALTIQAWTAEQYESKKNNS